MMYQTWSTRHYGTTIKKMFSTQALQAGYLVLATSLLHTPCHYGLLNQIELGVGIGVK